MAKWQGATTHSAKFDFFKDWLADPDSLSSLVIEAEYEEMAEASDDSEWVELPLAELHRMFQTPEEKTFLETEVVGKQAGRPHPQDSTGQNKMMMMYWVFRLKKENEKNSKRVGHRMTATGEVPMNRAALSAVSDHMTCLGADFGGKAKGKSGSADPGKGPLKGKGAKGKGQEKGEPVPKKRAKKACAVLQIFASTLQLNAID